MRQKGYGAHAIGYFKVRILYFVILFLFSVGTSLYRYPALSVWPVPHFLGILPFSFEVCTSLFSCPACHFYEVFLDILPFLCCAVCT